MAVVTAMKNELSFAWNPYVQDCSGKKTSCRVLSYCHDTINRDVLWETDGAKLVKKTKRVHTIE